ncbi:MAG: hypothetical protein JWQ69_799 [Pseudomonas sp.]|nr:hypothetical protein [Pseudomonas sp.]
MIAPSSSQLLTLWEQGERRHPLDRGLLLYGFAAAETPLQDLADAPLGQCNAALMRLRQAMFGNRLSLWADCPGCGQRMEFELDSAQLPPMTAAPEWFEVHVQGQRQRFRCPSSRDLAKIAHNTDLDQAADQLLQACAGPDVTLPTDPDIRRSLREAVENALEAADPWADLSLLFQCPACNYSGDACFDIGQVLWENFDARARHILNEVHLLAQAYGWSEPQILALSDARRAAYLARVNP